MSTVAPKLSLGWTAAFHFDYRIVFPIQPCLTALLLPVNLMNKLMPILPVMLDASLMKKDTIAESKCEAVDTDEVARQQKHLTPEQ